MNKDEIDLSAYPSYLGVRSATEPQDHRAGPREAVGRGLVWATLAGLIGIVLGAAVSRQTLLMVNIDTMVGAVTSGAMVLLYARGAKAPPRRGLIPLVVLLLFALFVGITAIMVARSWWVYSLLDDELGMPMSRSSFIWGLFADHGIFAWNLLFPFLLSSVAGSCLALWKVRHRPKG